MLSYRRETALQRALVLAKSGRLKLEDNILQNLNMGSSTTPYAQVTDQKLAKKALIVIVAP